MGKLIVANYKMNGDKNFYTAVQKKFKKLKLQDTKIILCPPFVYLPFLKKINKNVEIGSQDITNRIDHKSTGQISPEMLKEFDVKYCLIGHAERYSVGENIKVVKEKISVAIKSNIQPIICVGEEKEELAKQIEFLLKEQPNFMPVFAYEPQWAIDTGKVAAIKEINSVVEIIKSTCKTFGFESKVLYGGSVDLKTYQQLKSANVDGFLLGGVCLDINETNVLIKEVDNE